MTAKIEVTIDLMDLVGSDKIDMSKTIVGEMKIDIRTLQVMSGEFDPDKAKLEQRIARIFQDKIHDMLNKGRDIDLLKDETNDINEIKEHIVDVAQQAVSAIQSILFSGADDKQIVDELKYVVGQALKNFRDHADCDNCNIKATCDNPLREDKKAPFIPPIWKAETG